MTSGLRLMQSVATFRATVLTGANEDVPVSRYGGALIYIYIYKYTCIYMYICMYIYTNPGIQFKVAIAVKGGGHQSRIDDDAKITPSSSSYHHIICHSTTRLLGPFGGGKSKF
jgi:hypothetical protein